MALPMISDGDLDQAIPDRLPLVDCFLAEWARGRRPLEGVTAVLIQHQLGSMVPMVRALVALGLDPTRTFFVDIPYTANATVRAALQEVGIPSDHFAPAAYTLERPYAAYQRRRVQDLAAHLRAVLRADDPLLVLDDGSYFLEAVSCYAAPLGDLHVVEQTTRGLIKIENDAALEDYARRIPVVDVASSGPKSRWEGPWIGDSVCRALRAGIGDLELGGSERCLILGYGTIGRAVAQSLTQDAGMDPARVHVLDPQPPARERAIADGHALWDRRHPERLRFKLVVGCSGRESFGIGDRVFLDDGAVLASASSGSAELSREAFVELADTHPHDDIHVVDRETLTTRSLHDPIDILLVDRTVRFLNGGFPVNFDGRVNCVAPSRIQVTRTLMLGAALQAMETDERGIVPLDRDFCAWVDATYPRLSDVAASVRPGA